MPLTTTQVPYTGPYSVDGYGHHHGPTAFAMKIFAGRLGLIPWEPDVWDDRWNLKLETALDRWDPGKDGYAEGRWQRARATKIPAGKPHAGEYALNAQAQKLIRDEKKAAVVAVPQLGPVYNGGPSILTWDLTHPTDGVPLYPAADTAFSAGTGIIAPEALTVIEASHSAPGHAFYCRGKSNIRYWFGHLDRDQPVGRSFQRSDLIGRVMNQGRAKSHCHVGINVELIWGAGLQLAHHDNYTHGAPLIGDQLRAHAMV